MLAGLGPAALPLGPQAGSSEWKSKSTQRAPTTARSENDPRAWSPLERRENTRSRVLHHRNHGKTRSAFHTTGQRAVMIVLTQRREGAGSSGSRSLKTQVQTHFKRLENRCQDTGAAPSRSSTSYGERLTTPCLSGVVDFLAWPGPIHSPSRVAGQRGANAIWLPVTAADDGELVNSEGGPGAIPHEMLEAFAEARHATVVENPAAAEPSDEATTDSFGEGLEVGRCDRARGLPVSSVQGNTALPLTVLFLCS